MSINIKKRLGLKPSTWDDKRTLYMVRLPTYEETQLIPAEFNGLEPYCKVQGDQGNVGTCGGWGGKGIIYTLSRLNDNKTIDFSAGSIYVHSRDYDTVPPFEEGTTPIGVLKALQKLGATTEECTPTPTSPPIQITECDNWEEIAAFYKIGSYHQVPTDQASMKAAIYGITYVQPYKMPDDSPGKAPLALGIPVYESFKIANTNGGIVPQPLIGEKLLGGHFIITRGWELKDDEDRFSCPNSWGFDVGELGIYYLPMTYPIWEAWMATDDPPMPQPAPAPIPPELSDCKIAKGYVQFGNSVAKLMKRETRIRPPIIP
jgi:hypothetical protein